MRYWVFAVLLSLSTPLLHAEPPFDPRANLSGLWSDVNDGNFENTYLIIAQDGDNIHTAHYLEWKGQAFVEYGHGQRDGDTVTLAVTVTRPIPGWATEGVHTLHLSETGDTLEGRYKTPDGDSGPLTFKRIR